MNRHQKESVVSQLRDSFSHSEAAFLIEYRGLTVSQLERLRGDLRQKGGSFKITKARLMKLAVDGLDGQQDLTPFFKEQVGLVFATKETPTVAKVLNDFAKQHEALKLIVGCLDKKILQKNDVIRIASLPTREVLLAQLAGTMNAPISNLASVLNLMIVRLVWVLKQIEDQKK
jgi:large subunit ribosomal protein L10